MVNPVVNWKALRVNLTNRTVQVESLDPLLVRKFMGGRALGAYYLLKEIPANADPLGPENKLIFATGVLTYSQISGANRYSVLAKSPLTGGFGEAEAGGWWGPALVAAGFNLIIFEGKADSPVYLFVQDGKAELKDAAPIWGKGNRDTYVWLRAQHGSSIRSAQIGPAGENLVRYACIVNEVRHVNGRSGLGAVMGSKKVKAIVVHGTKSIPVADMDAYRKAGMALYKACKDSEGLKDWTRYGTTIVVSWCDEVGALPTRNFSAGSFEDGKNLYGPVMREKIVITDKGCFGCPSPCGKYSRNKKYNSYVEGPEYETIGLMGSNLGIDDIEAVAQANLLCDDLGIDTISTGNVIGWAMECYEKGIFTKKDTGGLDLKFGNVEATFTLIDKIARREGLGALLAEGVKRASKKVGKGSEKFAIQVKGMEQSAYATHNATAMLLAYMTCDVGAHHNRSWAITYDLQVGREKVVPEKVARVIWLQNFRPMFDVLGGCRLQWVELGIDRDLYVPALEAITGIHRSWEDLDKVGERIWNLTRLFWARENEGFGRAWDMPSPRFYEEAPKSGATKGQITKIEDVNRLLDMYYEQRGWTSDGLPKPETIESLGLNAVVA